MALVDCPECGKQVSSEAAACPGCGHPIKTESPEDYEYMTRPIIYGVLGDAVLVQNEAKKWAAQGWELHKQNPGQAFGGPTTVLTFRRRKSPDNPPAPPASCCVLPAAILCAALVSMGCLIAIRLLS
jgi:endogenous inhibitor of DNA gyrase (YacG/DUF329 family)